MKKSYLIIKIRQRVIPKFCVNVKQCIKEYMMRPIVIVVGLICILAHDYSIVKIKMLFGYSVAIVDNQLSVDATPVLTATCPLFRNVLHGQIQHFKKTVICRKYGLCLSYFFQLTVKAFYGIGCIDKLSQLLQKFEVGAQISPVVIPGL